MDAINKRINPWLQQRQEILIILHNLAGLLPQKVQENEISLTEFFQLLIDYVCAGHLQIFGLILQQSAMNVLETKDILKKINDTTSCIVQCNYKFNRFKNLSSKDVINLLEQFANRIELEDLLINTPISIKINKSRYYIN